MTPASSTDEDRNACELSDEIYNLWFDEAIFKGRYPKNTLKLFSHYMPENFESDLPLINQKIDWLGINYYTRSIIKADIPRESSFLPVLAITTATSPLLP